MALTFLQLPADIHYRLSLRFSLENLSYLAQTSHALADLLSDERYWCYRFQQHYGSHIQGELKVKSWKEAYLNFGRLYLRVQYKYTDPGIVDDDEPEVGKLVEMPFRGHKFSLGSNALLVWNSSKHLQILHWYQAGGYRQISDGYTASRTSMYELAAFKTASHGSFDFMVAPNGDLCVFYRERETWFTRFYEWPQQFPSEGIIMVRCPHRNFIYIDRENHVYVGVAGAIGEWIPTQKVTYKFNIRKLEMKAKYVDIFRHMLIIDLENNVWAAGANEYDQLGTGNCDNIYYPKQPVQLPYIKAQQVACGGTFSLILDLAGQVYILGHIPELDEEEGTTIAIHHKPILVPGITAIQVVAGGYYNCAILDVDHNVWVYDKDNEFKMIPDMKALRLDTCLNKLAILAHPSPV